MAVKAAAVEEAKQTGSSFAELVQLDTEIRFRVATHKWRETCGID